MASCVPSGETRGSLAPGDVHENGPLPRPPPAVSVLRHSELAMVHRQVAPSIVTSRLFSPSRSTSVENGSVTAVLLFPGGAGRAAAILAWSNSGRFSRVSASTRVNSKPPFTDRRYQKACDSPIHETGPATLSAAPS